jgi:Capsule polysaccharide biosynthesis protein
MTDATFLLQRAGGRRTVHLDDYLDPEAEERATRESLVWIKAVRSARIDGEPLRRRFTLRGDSLWWFAELYLHKQQVIANLFRTAAALEALMDTEAPERIELLDGGRARYVQGLAPQAAAARGVRYTGPAGFADASRWRLAGLETRASALNAAALASRLRTRPVPASTNPRAVAFVHRAFWRPGADDGGAEAYIGPVLQALEHRLERGEVAYVTLGPATNFRARRWWHALAADPASGATLPIEVFAPLGRLDASRGVWQERHRMRRLLWKSADLRALSVIRGYDCWPIVREELAGIALLQWPWSARAMDEAAAALDVLEPRVAVTYAEAGGWGRAIVLEARRRGIPVAGLQHGFIYRHWLNYLHEPDEMVPDPAHPGDQGFPRPTSTLVFDRYAAGHLSAAGNFPAASLAITGSPRLDALVNEVRRLTAADLERARAGAGAATGTLVVVTTKFKEARSALGRLIEAAGTMHGVHIAIKTHPAETPDVYAAAAAGQAHVTVLDAAAPLAPLLAASRAVVTVNSTVALDAAVLDVPALVIGQPNNLTPFVEAGVMAGAPDASAAAIARALGRILYDEEFRCGLGLARRDFLARHGIDADGRAAERAADAILELAKG